MRLLARKIYYLPEDIFLKVTGKKKKLVPDKGDIFIGAGDFIEQGNHHLKLLRQYTGLKPYHEILDVGCGIGRSAVASRIILTAKGNTKDLTWLKKG